MENNKKDMFVTFELMNHNDLTKREIQYVRLFLSGFSHREMMSYIPLELKTIEGLRYSLYKKWNVIGQYALVLAAFNRGFLDDFLMVHSRNGQTKQERLTKREAEVLKLLCIGKTLVEVAKILELSYRTIEGHLINIRFKWNVNSAPDLIYAAIEQGYLIVAKKEPYNYQLLFSKNTLLMTENVLSQDLKEQ